MRGLGGGGKRGKITQNDCVVLTVCLTERLRTDLCTGPATIADERLDKRPLGAVLLNKLNDKGVLLLREGAFLARLGLLAAAGAARPGTSTSTLQLGQRCKMA